MLRRGIPQALVILVLERGSIEEDILDNSSLSFQCLTLESR